MSAQNIDPPVCVGLAALMRLAFEGRDLEPVASQFIQRAQNNPDDAAAMLDLATVLELNFQPDIAHETRAQALNTQSLYRLPPNGEAGLRLLAIMAPGNLNVNTPLPFLLENSNVSLDMLYVGPGVASVTQLPEHDVLFVAIGESEATHSLLAELVPVMDEWPCPVLNLPERIMMTSRDAAYKLLRDIPGIMIPPSKRIERIELERLVNDIELLDQWLPVYDFPLIIRPVDSHAGHDLAKIETPDDIAGYLGSLEETTTRFFISPFIDYRNRDGLYRKYRIVMIDGIPYAGHMAISDHWMIHYLNAGMRDSKAKRAEEADFMMRFETEFARQHADALEALYQRFQLDYLVIDCARTASGELLVFEVDTGAVVHAMDSLDIFPYKGPAMNKVFNAFQAFLAKTAEGR